MTRDDTTRHDPTQQSGRNLIDSAQIRSTSTMIDNAHETAMTAYLTHNFVSLGKDRSILVLEQTLLMLVYPYSANGDLLESSLNLKCSMTHITKFLKRNWSIFQRFRLCRQFEVDEEEAKQFVISFYMLSKICDPRSAINGELRRMKLAACHELRENRCATRC
jgi:hypothetical protein